jgi:hypothetical protein
MSPTTLVRLLLVALLGNTIFVAAVFSSIGPIGPPPERLPVEPFVSYILSGIALGMIPLALLASMLLRRPTRAEVSASPAAIRSQFIARRLVPAAILEAGSLKSMIGFLLEGQTFSIIVGALLAGLIVTLWPSARAFETEFPSASNSPADFPSFDRE